MIARSDLFILVVSASLLAAGILRWQSNVSAMNTASSTARPAPVAVTPAPAARTNTPSVVAAAAPDAPGAVQVSAQLPQAVTAQTQAAQPDSANSNNVAVAIASTDSTLQGTASNTQTRDPLYGTYIVKSGDFLGRIAQTYGTSVDTLRQINGISGSLIEVGQEIQYPLPAN